MARLLPNTLAAFAAVLIVAVSMNAVVIVPPAHATILAMPELA